MLDTGANVSAVSEELFEKLKLKSKRTWMNLGTFGQKENGLELEIANFKICNMKGDIEIVIDDAIVSDELTIGLEKPPKNSDISHLDYMSGVDLIDLGTDKVNMILSAKYAYHYFGGLQARKKSLNDPVAVLTDFGWCLVGMIREDIPNEVQINAIFGEETILKRLDNMYYADFCYKPIEDFPAEMTHHSQADKYAIDQMLSSMKHLEDGHYEVATPWILGREATREEFAKRNSLGTAIKRMDNLRKKFQKNPALKEGSFKQMQETIDLGHAVVIDDLSAPEGAPVWYMPDLVVLHPDKPGKFRVCQDASAKSGGRSLNDYLLDGPDVMNKLLGILLRMREGPYFITGDIANFFYQVRINPLDAPAFRYLWWECQKMEKIIYCQPRDYIFGAACSPAICNMVIQVHATKMREQGKISQEVYLACLLAIYMDDLMKGGIYSVEEGKKFKDEVNKMMLEGGFTMTKWRSNHPELSDPPPPVSPPQVADAPKDSSGSSTQHSKRDGETPGSERISSGSSNDVHGVDAEGTKNATLTIVEEEQEKDVRPSVLEIFDNEQV